MVAAVGAAALPAASTGTTWELAMPVDLSANGSDEDGNEDGSRPARGRESNEDGSRRNQQQLGKPRRRHPHHGETRGTAAARTFQAEQPAEQVLHQVDGHGIAHPG